MTMFFTQMYPHKKVSRDLTEKKQDLTKMSIYNFNGVNRDLP